MTTTRLFNAAKYGLRELIEILVNEGAAVDSNNEEGLTPLFLAAEHRHYEIAIYLVKAGADCNVIDRGKWTPLYFAARDGHEKLVKTLLNAGADVNLKDTNGLSPLYFAAENGHYDIAIRLVKAGADCNVMNTDKWTPLYFAARDGHEKLVKTLLNAGADVNLKDTNELSPLYFAAENGHYEIAIRLVKAGADCNVMNTDKWTPLCFAARDDHEELVKTLIKYFCLYNSESVMPDFPFAVGNELIRFWNICTAQVEDLKRTVLGNCNISFLKFLLEKDLNKLVNYLSNVCMAKDLKEVIFTERFFVYREMLIDQFLKGQQRKYLFQSIESLISNCSLKILPCDVQKSIFSYLSNPDLIKLSESFSSLEPSEQCNEKRIKKMKFS